MSKTVLVTGGTGSIGSWAIVELLKRGYSVRTTVRSLDKGGGGSRADFVGGRARRPAVLFRGRSHQGCGLGRCGRRLRLCAPYRGSGWRRGPALPRRTNSPDARWRASRPSCRLRRPGRTRRADVGDRSVQALDEESRRHLRRNGVDRPERSRSWPLPRCQDAGRAGRLGLHGKPDGTDDAEHGPSGRGGRARPSIRTTTTR